MDHSAVIQAYFPSLKMILNEKSRFDISVACLVDIVTHYPTLTPLGGQYRSSLVKESRMVGSSSSTPHANLCGSVKPTGKKHGV